MTTRNIGEHAVVVETTCAAFPLTLMVLAICCAFSSLRSAAKETVNPVGEVTAVAGARVVSRTVGAGRGAPAPDGVELAESESRCKLSLGNVTGWSRPFGRGLKPSQAKKYQKSFPPPAKVDFTLSFSGSANETSFPLRRASIPSGVTAGRSVSHRVGTAPTSRLSPIAITQAESAFGIRASR